MNLSAKEYRGIIAASAFAFLSIGGGGAFLWQATANHAAAKLKLENRIKEFNRLRGGTPAPTEESRLQLGEQKKSSSVSAQKLHAALSAMNIPLEKIQPQDFQTALNTRTQNFATKAAKSRIQILPKGARDSDPFSMDCDEGAGSTTASRCRVLPLLVSDGVVPVLSVRMSLRLIIR
jgi:hypothetical protein